MAESITITALNRDPKCQSRVEMDLDVVDDYAEAMAEGATFPPIIVFFDQTAYWLADGFHRVAAAEKAGIAEINADVRQGGIREAELFALGVNDAHGLQRSRADKQRAVEKALADPELRQWTDNAIAKQCKVSNHYVAKVRASLGVNQENGQRTYRDRWGNVATMDVSKIGKTQGVEKKQDEDVPLNESLAGVVRQLVVKFGHTDVERTTNVVLREMSEWR